MENYKSLPEETDDIIPLDFNRNWNSPLFGRLLSIYVGRQNKMWCYSERAFLGTRTI